MKRSKEQPFINTVNVIELDEGTVQGMASYKDDKPGNKAAEARFRKICKECITVGRLNKAPSDEDIDTMIEEGTAENGTYSLLLVHSTEPSA